MQKSQESLERTEIYALRQNRGFKEWHAIGKTDF